MAIRTKTFIEPLSQQAHKLNCCVYPNGLGICGCNCHVKAQGGRTKQKPIARLVITGLNDDKFNIDRLKAWLRAQADFLEDKEPADFGKLFTARLM